MKNRHFLSLIALTVSAAAYAQTPSGVGINTIAPKATLDVVGKPIDAENLAGVIAPRLRLDQLNAAQIYTADQTGAIVYVNDITTNIPSPYKPAGQTINIRNIGYYYFDGDVWQMMSGNDWHLTGNTLGISNDLDSTTPPDPDAEFTVGDRYLGTNDENPLVFKVNEQWAGYISNVDTKESGNFNAFGLGALENNVPQKVFSIYYGVGNNAFGHNALNKNVIGRWNTAFGDQALANNDNDSNTAFGYRALANGDSSLESTAVGTSAMERISDIKNVAVGNGAMSFATEGCCNVAVGNVALAGASTITAAAVTGNTAIGSSALSTCILCEDNIAIGSQAGNKLEEGSYNILLDASQPGAAGSIMTKGDSNIFLRSQGNTVNPLGNLTEINNMMNIGDVVFGVNMYDVAGTIPNTVNLPAPSLNTNTAISKIGIGTAKPQTKLEINGAATNTASSIGTSISTTNFSIDFTTSNLARIAPANDPVSATLNGMKDGGTYTLAVQRDVAAAIPRAGFTAPKLGGGGNFTIYYTDSTGSTSGHRVYTIVCIGDVAYIYVTVLTNT
ncbi:MAG: hypothetical protein LBE36_05065 [Flavobacteriaceae bacterium]|jgi:hypothetical protein|nr:hypothetical protein [Flavobacteriaceae bacterium]